MILALFILNKMKNQIKERKPGMKEIVFRTSYFVLFLSQSFHKKGNNITASIIIITSKAISNRTVLAGMIRTGLKAALESFISNSNCGMINGKPSTAIIAAFCCALAAMAAKKVKTRLRLHPPSNTRPMNGPAF
jgi:hypothetical protein